MDKQLNDEFELEEEYEDNPMREYMKSKYDVTTDEELKACYDLHDEFSALLRKKSKYLTRLSNIFWGTIWYTAGCTAVSLRLGTPIAPKLIVTGIFGVAYLIQWKVYYNLVCELKDSKYDKVR